jgi:hypothetical protein
MTSAPASIRWIDDGEKYGLVALSVKVEGDIPPGSITPNLCVLTDTTFPVATLWREWLGSIRTDQIEACNLFLFAKLSSLAPDIDDDENKSLSQRAQNFYVGFLLASTFAPAHDPVLLTGSRQGGKIDIREQRDLDCPDLHPYPPVVPEHVRIAAQLGENLQTLPTTPLPGGPWRLFRTLHVYREARSLSQIIDRLHQYCRCIEGLILPDTGQTKKQFKGRTELFIGPRHHDMMDEIYDVRSTVEHLQENRYLETFDRPTRLDLLKKTTIAEHIARTALARIIGQPSLWPHFANTSALAQFWSRPTAEREKIWGHPIDPMQAVADFDPKYIHDGLLGAE